MGEGVRLNARAPREGACLQPLARTRAARRGAAGPQPVWDLLCSVRMSIAIRLGAVVLALVGSAFVGSASAAAFHRTLTLDDAVGAAESDFGISIAAAPAGGVVVGSSGGDTGSAQLFDATSGALRTVILQPDDSMSFGRTVAATATDILVGDAAAFADDSASGAIFGAVYRFDPAGTPLGTFFSPTPSTTFAFASQIAVRGGEVLVRDQQAVDRFDVASGALLGILAAPAGASSDFGLALLGGVSAIFAGDPTAQRVYVFDPQSGGLLQTLAPPPAATAGRFGASLAFLGGDLLVGAPGGVGAVFRIDPVSGAVRAVYDNPLGTPNIGFGNAVGVLGDAVVVGAPSFSLSESGISDGAAFVFDAASQALVAVLARQSPDYLDSFGAAVVPVAEQIFVGVPHEDAAEVEAFALDCGGDAACGAADVGLTLRSARIAADRTKVRAILRMPPAEFAALRNAGQVCLLGGDGPIACTAWDDPVCTGSANSFRCRTDGGTLAARRSRRGRGRLVVTLSTIDPAALPPPTVVLRLTLGSDDDDDPTRAGAARKCRVQGSIAHCR